MIKLRRKINYTNPFFHWLIRKNKGHERDYFILGIALAVGMLCSLCGLFSLQAVSVVLLNGALIMLAALAAAFVSVSTSVFHLSNPGYELIKVTPQTNTNLILGFFGASLYRWRYLILISIAMLPFTIFILLREDAEIIQSCIQSTRFCEYDQMPSGVEWAIHIVTTIQFGVGVLGLVPLGASIGLLFGLGIRNSLIAAPAAMLFLLFLTPILLSPLGGIPVSFNGSLIHAVSACVWMLAPYVFAACILFSIHNMVRL